MAGRRLGLAGEVLPTLLASGCKADLTHTAVSILENVPALPQRAVEDAFGDHFIVVGANLAPADVGFECIARPRTGTVSEVRGFC